MGAFVLPNKEIPDSADIRSFITPGKLLVVCRAREGAGGRAGHMFGSKPGRGAVLPLVCCTRASRGSIGSVTPGPPDAADA